MNLGTRGALTFRLGDYNFAVRVEEAGGVLDADRLAQLPGVAEPVAGVAAFRGADRFALLVPEIPRLVAGRDLREAPPEAPDPELSDLFESTLVSEDQDHYHCLNYWQIFESIIPQTAASAARDVHAKRTR